MKKQKENKSRPLRTLAIAGACGVGMLMTSCVTTVPVAYTTPAAGVHHYPTTAHTSHVVHRNHVVHPRPVARAASPVGVHGTARRTSRRVSRRR